MPELKSSLEKWQSVQTDPVIGFGGSGFGLHNVYSPVEPKQVSHFAAFRERECYTLLPEN